MMCWFPFCAFTSERSHRIVNDLTQTQWALISGSFIRMPKKKFVSLGKRHFVVLSRSLMQLHRNRRTQTFRILRSFPSSFLVFELNAPSALNLTKETCLKGKSVWQFHCRFYCRNTSAASFKMAGSKSVISSCLMQSAMERSRLSTNLCLSCELPQKCMPFHAHFLPAKNPPLFLLSFPFFSYWNAILALTVNGPQFAVSFLQLQHVNRLRSKLHCPSCNGKCLIFSHSSFVGSVPQ